MRVLTAAIDKMIMGTRAMVIAVEGVALRGKVTAARVAGAVLLAVPPEAGAWRHRTRLFMMMAKYLVI